VTADQADALINHIEAALGRAEGRLAGVVNERTTRVIDATTVVIGGLHEEIQSTTEALNELSANLVERRRYLDERLALDERRIETLADLIPGGAEALGEPPLRQMVDAFLASAATDRAQLWAAVAHLRIGLVVICAIIVVLLVALSRGWL
jgi:hypothetical protein